MAHRLPQNITTQAQIRAAANAVRVTQPNGAGVDLSSNDYLGVARHLASEEIAERVLKAVRGRHIGSTGSRLVSGTTREHLELESFLAMFHQAESALLFGSGYEANIGLLACIASRSDTIIYDELLHSSMRDGIRLSSARAYSFKHNDLEDLERKIKAARGECFIAVESIYSMDGDRAPLSEICDMAERVGAFIIVDEAHSTGVFGPMGAGLVVESGLDSRVFARVHTFGKALGYRGACVVGSHALREHLVNSARSFIYTTALDAISLHYIREAYKLVKTLDVARAHLANLIRHFMDAIKVYPNIRFLPSDSPIQAVLIPGNSNVVAAELALRNAGCNARAIRAPTVPQGLERIRLCLHSYNTQEEIQAVLTILSEHEQDSDHERGAHVG